MHNKKLTCLNNSHKKSIFPFLVPIISLLLLSISYISFADEITIGAGTTTGTHKPTEAGYDYSYTEQIFLQNEIATQGYIDSIYFYWTGNAARTRTVIVHMAHTTKSSFTSSTDWVTSSGMTSVYSGSYSLTGTAGWHKIVLSTPFYYNNSDNLIIGFDDNTGSWSSTADEFNATDHGTYRSIYAYQDLTNVNSTAPSATYQARSTSCANIKIVINPDAIGIGTGTTQTIPLPTEVLYDYSYTQQIYLQSDIDAGEAVNIDSLYFYWDGAGAENRTIVMYMTNTSKSSFSSGSDWVTSGLTQVYSGTYALTATTGWHKIVLDDPFYYNNSDNLLISFDDNTGSWSTSNDFYCTNQGTNRSIYKYQDNTNISPSGPPAGTQTSYCANLLLMTSPGTALTAPVAGAGTCLSFDGSGDYVYINDAGVSSAFTLEFWIKPNSVDDADRIFLQGSGANASVQIGAVWDDDYDQIHFVRATGTAIPPQAETAPITDDNSTWTHVAWTFDGASTHNVYVNGQSSSGTDHSGNYYVEGNFYIGCRGESNNMFNGSLDNVRLWSDVRTQAEIQAYMYETLDTTSTDANNLVLAFRFDEPSGATAICFTDDPANGTITGATRETSEAWKNRSTDDDTPITFFAGYDPNEDAVTLSETVAPSNGVLLFDHTNVEITYVPDKNASGADAFTFQISDGTETDTYQMSITCTNNNIAPVAGSGNCLAFDGVNEYVLLPDGDMVNTTWTLEFWVKPNSPGNHERIFLLGADATSNRQIMALWYGGHIEFYHSGSGSAGTPQIATGTITDDNSTWTHVAWVYTGSHTVYVNGQSSSGTVGGGSCGVSGSSYIGTWDAQSDKCWTGSLDEIRLWDDVRTLSEIQDNRYTALVGNESNLVGYWRFDESDGDFAYDYAGADDHGYLKNMEDGDWTNCNTWKYRSMQTSATLSHCAGYDPDGGGLPSDITEVTGPSAGTLTFDQVNDECDYTASATPGTITYTYRVSDGASTDDYDMEIEVTGSEDYSTWSFSKNFYLNTTVTGANVENDVYNFPALIRLDTTNFDFSEPLSTGYDIRFSKSDIDQHLYYERERWTLADSVAEFWVRVDTVQGNDNTQYIKMFWGKAGASDASSASDVFKTDANYDFAGVWHMNEDPSTGGSPVLDRTANGNHMAANGSLTSGDLVKGLVGKGIDFDRSEIDYLSKTSPSGLPSSQITLSAWVKPSSLDDYDNILKHNWGASGGWNIFLDASNRLNVGVNDGTAKYDQITDLSTGNWYYIVGTFDGSNITAYLNGTSSGSPTAASVALNTSADLLIAGNTAGSAFNGIIDEAVVSSTARSADWIKLCYENQRLAQTLVHDENYANWTYNSNWTINTTSSGADVSSDVTDFPLLLRFDANNFTFADAMTNGQDLRFARTIGSDEKHLYYEIERWDDGSDVGEVWVRVDSIKGNDATQYIKMYWGNSGVRNRSRGDRVFDVSEGFAGTWHLAQDPGPGAAGDIMDATFNANHGQAQDNMLTEDLVDGTVGKGIDFDGTDDNISIPASTSIGNLTNSFTVSAWIKSDLFDATRRFFSANRTLTNNGFAFGVQNPDELIASTYAVKDYISTTFAMTTVNWYLVTAVIDAGYDATFYVNGAGGEMVTHTAAGSANTDDPFQIGSGSGVGGALSEIFNGVIDEMRIENGIRSADWVKLCYETQRSDQITVTSEEVELLPITVHFGEKAVRGAVRGYDTCEIYTDDWKIIFDEEIGGGIKWLSDESQGGGGNQCQDDKNLFYIRTDNTGAHTVTGTLTLKESNSLFCNLLQEFAINGRDWDVEYNIYGNGRMFVRVSFEALDSYDPVGGLKFMVRSDVTNRGYYTETGDGDEEYCNYLLHSDQASSRFDILFALYEDWSQADAYTATDANDWFGIDDPDWEIAAGKKQIWEFMIDFAHKKWNDTTNIGKVVDDYREPDSLEFIKGAFRMEKSWQHRMVGHWPFDEASSGSANADTAFDYSPATHYGVITGGDWADGKWNNGLDLDGASDLVTLTTPETFDQPLTFTIMAWIKKDGTSETDDMIFGKYNHAAGEGYRLYSHDDTLRMDLYSHADTGNTALGTDWRHVAVTFDKYQGWFKLFVDGKVDAIKQIMPTVKASSIDATIGNSFAGIIDDVRFYNEAISEETVRAIALNGYRVSQGQYMLRADNNNTIHIKIDGSSAEPEYFPIFQIANYWQTHTPYAVYYDGSRMATTADYITSLDDDDNILYLGFNKKVTTTDLLIYIDDTDSSGAFMVDPMPTMTYGSDVNGYYVKNTSSDSFGASGSNEFYLYWRMDETATGMGGELSEFRSSDNTASQNDLISNGTNLIPSSNSYGTFGYHDHYRGASWASSAAEVSTSSPTYTVLEASDVRVKIQVNERQIDDTNAENILYNLTTIWTVYPTGQIFRYDSLRNIQGGDLTYQFVRFRVDYEAASTVYKENHNADRCVIYGTATSHDYVVAWTGSADKNGSKNLYVGYSDTVMWQSSASNYMGWRFGGATYVAAANAPYQSAFYMDIRHQDMDSLYMDSVSDGVQYIDYTTGDFTGGTGELVDSTKGDIDGDGFNEGEGAYVMRADDNSINFLLEADETAGDEGCRFYPVLRILRYTATTKPKYVHLYNASDTLTLVEDYTYNAYLNDAQDELIVQIDSVLCADTKIYISADDELAVELSDFYAKSGDGNDTLFWKTESEEDNLGFFLFRRIKPAFLDSLFGVIDSVADSLLDNAGIMLKQGKIGFADTAWLSLTKDIIPSQYKPGEIPGIPRKYRKIDWDVENDIVYEYKLIAIDKNRQEEEFGPIQVTPQVIFPVKFFLFHNFPNPARFYTNFRFDLPVKSKVALYVYNLQGRLIYRILKPDRYMKPGFYRLRWNCKDQQGRKIASGPYVYRFVAKGANKKKYAKNRMMILIK
ncbi:DUF2341 domain-containing protein [Fibrobacterota bacterium]